MSKTKLGAILRGLRMEKGMPLRKVAAQLDIDVAILSKMERGQRKLTREIVVQLAEIYQQNLEPLMIQFLSEKVLYEIGNEKLASQVIQVAEASIAYSLKTNESKEVIISKIIAYLKTDKRIKTAWLYGSVARGEMNAKSDVDLMVKFDEKKKISLFDIAEIVHALEQVVSRKIDLVEEGTLLPFALKSAKKDLIKIYG
ncbi:MAG TPA: nucleotidyltransferase domain-containing protein [Saprospiraceae bacterium]|nr:nucleotidyltransferase domain-containing protein [Saprospiraceae bacterium]